jgi:hypothetical protein
MSSRKFVLLAIVALIAVFVWQALSSSTMMIGDDLLIGDAPKIILGFLGFVVGIMALLLTGVLLTGVFFGLGVIVVGLFLLLLSIPLAMALPVLLLLMLLAGLIHLFRRNRRHESLPRAGDSSELNDH